MFSQLQCNGAVTEPQALPLELVDSSIIVSV